MKAVMNTTHVTVPFVFFSFPAPRSLALSPNMADGPAIVTFLCMEKDFVITIPVRYQVTFHAK